MSHITTPNFCQQEGQSIATCMNEEVDPAAECTARTCERLLLLRTVFSGLPSAICECGQLYCREWPLTCQRHGKMNPRYHPIPSCTRERIACKYSCSRHIDLRFSPLLSTVRYPMKVFCDKKTSYFSCCLHCRFRRRKVAIILPLPCCKFEYRHPKLPAWQYFFSE